jgi:hypothetical protein
MKPNLQAPAETATNPHRRRRVIAGEGKLTPTKPLLFSNERLWPGRARWRSAMSSYVGGRRTFAPPIPRTLPREGSCGR